MKRLISILATVVVATLSLSACAGLPQPAEPSQTPSESTATTPSHNLVPPNATDEGSGVAPFKDRTKAGAPVVEVFFDYQCPACANFERAFAAELGRMGEAGEIALVYRPMVFLDINHGNDASTRAAVAATCSDVHGKYEAYHEALFELIQSGYPDAVLTGTIPGRVGITGADLETFQQCYQGRRTLDFVRGADKLAISAGVNSTPTIRVNGKPIDLRTLTFDDPTSLRKAIEAAA